MRSSYLIINVKLRSDFCLLIDSESIGYSCSSQLSLNPNAATAVSNASVSLSTRCRLVLLKIKQFFTPKIFFLLIINQIMLRSLSVGKFIKDEVNERNRWYASRSNDVGLNRGSSRSEQLNFLRTHLDLLQNEDQFSFLKINF